MSKPTGIINIFADTAIYPEISDVIGEFQRSATESIEQDFFLMSVLPMRDVNALKCKLIMENEDWGLMKGRGVNNDFPNAPVPGFNIKEYQPGYFGEKSGIPEEAALRVREAGTEERPGVMAEEIGRRLRITKNRMVRRMKQVAADFLYRGEIVVKNEHDQVIYQDNVAFPSTTIGTSISDAANGAPIAYLMSLKLSQRAAAGAGEFEWDKTSTLVISPEIEAALMLNRNNNDLWGYFKQLNIIPGSMTAINAVMAALDLPQIVVYGGRYQASEDSARSLYGSADTMLWIGASAERGIKVGMFQRTKNLQLGGRPGMFAAVIPDPKGLAAPEVYGGFNGGVGAFQPAQIMRVKVIF